jgi:hypothetical protein
MCKALGEEALSLRTGVISILLQLLRATVWRGFLLARAGLNII